MKHLAEIMGLHLPDDTWGQLEKWTQVFLKENEKINLSAIRTLPEIQIKHALDSLAALPYLKSDTRVLDLGTGGGVPGLPLAIAYPDAEFTLMDSVSKKIHAVESMARELNLPNIKTHVGRAETVARDPKFREQFDVVLARALAPLNVLLELTYPFAKVGSQVILYKGPGFRQEIEKAQTAFKELHVSEPDIIPYRLSEDQGEHVLLIFTKEEPTPERYPRREGVPEKKPL